MGVGRGKQSELGSAGVLGGRCKPSPTGLLGGGALLQIFLDPWKIIPSYLIDTYLGKNFIPLKSRYTG